MLLVKEIKMRVVAWRLSRYSDWLTGIELWLSVPDSQVHERYYPQLFIPDSLDTILQGIMTNYASDFPRPASSQRLSYVAWTCQVKKYTIKVTHNESILVSSYTGKWKRLGVRNLWLQDLRNVIYMHEKERERGAGVLLDCSGHGLRVLDFLFRIRGLGCCWRISNMGCCFSFCSTHNNKRGEIFPLLISCFSVA